jgi:hypothetical protein
MFEGCIVGDVLIGYGRVYYPDHMIEGEFKDGQFLSKSDE